MFWERVLTRCQINVFSPSPALHFLSLPVQRFILFYCRNSAHVEVAKFVGSSSLQTLKLVQI